MEPSKNRFSKVQTNQQLPPMATGLRALGAVVSFSQAIACQISLHAAIALQRPFVLLYVSTLLVSPRKAIALSIHARSPWYLPCREPSVRAVCALHPRHYPRPPPPLYSRIFKMQHSDADLLQTPSTESCCILHGRMGLVLVIALAAGERQPSMPRTVEKAPGRQGREPRPPLPMSRRHSRGKPSSP